MPKYDDELRVISEVGQVWQDNDYRSRNRFVRIDRIDERKSPAYAVITILKDGDGTVMKRVGKHTRVLVRRLRPNSTGYKWVADTEDEWRAKREKQARR